MADQLRWDCLSAYGHLPVPTPHMDSLAAESVVFDRAYCASPLCTPTRTSMVTGKFPHVHGALVNAHNPRHPDRKHGTIGLEHRTVYECLSDGGYGVTYLGKLHVQGEPGIPERVPTGNWERENTWFEYARRKGLPGSNFAVPALRQYLMPGVDYEGGKRVMSWINPPVRVPYGHPAEDFYDVFLANRAVEIIQETDWSKPQYLEVQFWAPHLPLVLPEPYYSMFSPDQIQLPEDVCTWYPGQPANLLEIHPGQQAATRTRDEYRAAWAAYFGLVVMVDDCIGRVVKAIKERGIWDDSLVIFCTDHGEMLGSHWMMGKMCAYEASSRLAWMMKPPGATPGRRSQLVSSIDYASTVCDYAGTGAPEGAQGVSLRQYIDAPDAVGRDAVFMEWHGNQGLDPHYHMKSAIGDIAGSTWKAILHSTGEEELYDLKADPLETSNLAGKGAAETTALKHRLQSFGRPMASLSSSSIP